MSAPLIGLTTRNTDDPKYGFPLISSPKSYTQALIRAGAIPVLVPVNLPPARHADLLAQLDGIIFTGGGDMARHYFEGEDHPKIHNIDNERDETELALARAVKGASIPFMGICRGLQVINVAYGGTLYTHILDQYPGALEHACYPTHPTDYLAHPVQLKAGSVLAQAVGAEEVTVNSLHHQGIKTLAAGLEPLAWAPDGLVEAFQLPGHPYGLAVQWHPEWLPESPQMQAIFSSFVLAASQYQAGK